MNKMKLFRIKKVVCNSNFTKKIIDDEFGIESVVLYPPVDIQNLKPKLKTNSIVSVGRFSSLLQAKRQDVLVGAFKKLYDSKNPGWKLILAGGVEVGGREYLESLKEASIGYPISILESPDFKKLQELYGKAKMFWSASGFGVSEKNNPDKVEHFGITVVEAMAAGAVVLVHNAGGHKEIVEEGNGYLWDTEDDLIEKTQKLILNDKKMKYLSINAIKSSKKYSYDRFKKEFLSLI